MLPCDVGELNSSPRSCIALLEVTTRDLDVAIFCQLKATDLPLSYQFEPVRWR